MKRYLSKIAVVALTLLFPFIVNSGVWAQATPVSVSLSPSSGTYASGATFVSSININTGGAQIVAAQLVLTFDKSKLQFESIEYGDIIPPTEKGLLQGMEEVDNANGYVIIPALWLYGYQGNGRLANLTFKANNSGSTTISFNDVGEDTNGVYNQGDENNILGTKTGATYTIGSGGGSTTPPRTTPPSNTRPPTGAGTTNNLPDSGIEDYALLILGIIFIAIASSSIIVIKRKSTTS